MWRPQVAFPAPPAGPGRGRGPKDLRGLVVQEPAFNQFEPYFSPKEACSMKAKICCDCYKSYVCLKSIFHGSTTPLLVSNNFQDSEAGL